MSQSTLPNKPHVTVIGAGIIGLPTGVLLTEILNIIWKLRLSPKLFPILLAMSLAQLFCHSTTLHLDPPNPGKILERKHFQVFV